MGQTFIRSVLAQDEAVTVSTTVTYDLPVNPLSHILYTIRATNNTVTISNYTVLTALLASISQIEILHKGMAVISASLTDLALLASVIAGKGPGQFNLVRTDNDVRGVTVPIYLGRGGFNPLECFPAVRRGELQMRITYAAAQTGIDTLTAQIETIELPEANPIQFLKYTTISKTPSATGDHDLDLPIGNEIIGVQLYGTTVPTGASYNASIGKLRLLVDNIDLYYASTNWESLHNEIYNLTDWRYYPHVHYYDPTGAAAASTLQQEEDDSLIDNYALLDFDPWGNDGYLLNTDGRSRVNLRITADVADAIRAIPIELIRLAAPAM